MTLLEAVEGIEYKIKSNSHEIIENDTFIIPNSPKGRADLEIKVKKKIFGMGIF